MSEVLPRPFFSPFVIIVFRFNTFVKVLAVLFSFLTRFFSSKEAERPETLNADEQNSSLRAFVQSEGGKFFFDYKLYHQESATSVDILIFLPNYGIFVGEIINWDATELKNATVERSSVHAKRPAATQFNQLESKIRRKLEDVLSFDSTPIHRFIWMRHLSESEFDTLDPSFHELLPKNRILFSDGNIETVKTKLTSLGEYRHDPYSTLQIMGALNSHSYILPTSLNPSGSLLSPQQNLFLAADHEGVTILSGGYGSGKSTLLIRKALLHLLVHPGEKVLVITPTLLGSELLRNELISLLEYGALSVNLNALFFYNPGFSTNADVERIEDLRNFQDASIILCDDVHLMKKDFIDKLLKYRNNQSLMMTTAEEDISDAAFKLLGQFRRIPIPKKVSSAHNHFVIALILQLRKILVRAQTTEILVITSDEHHLIPIKEAVDEYFNLNCRVLLPSFSLQYQNLDSIIITTMECIAPFSRAHVFLMGLDPTDPNYPLALSRASETLIIISDINPV